VEYELTINEAITTFEGRIIANPEEKEAVLIVGDITDQPTLRTLYAKVKNNTVY
jgi:hypothetical protein